MTTVFRHAALSKMAAHGGKKSRRAVKDDGLILRHPRQLLRHTVRITIINISEVRAVLSAAMVRFYSSLLGLSLHQDGEDDEKYCNLPLLE